jgi:hypothetical protein
VSVITHPRFKKAAAAHADALRQRINADRERALATLGSIMATVEALHRQIGIEDLRSNLIECGVLQSALRGMDLQQPGDVLAEQLQLIERRLLVTAKGINKYVLEIAGKEDNNDH